MRMENHSSLKPSVGQYFENIESEKRFNRQALSALAPVDRARFEYYGRGPKQELPYHLIHKAVEHQVQTRGESIAAQHKQQSITYAELNQQAENLACELNQMGIGPGDNVGLFLERSIPMLVGILGILKAGAAYVPQDARITPAPILQDVIASAEIRVVLTLSHLVEKIPAGDNQRALAIDSLEKSQVSDNSHSSQAPQRAAAHQNDNCFILFTSGTTGKPNGVQVTHNNVCNILLTEPGDLGIQPGDKVPQLLNIAFDMAAWEILGCLSHGGTLVIRENNFTEAARDCDVIVATPSILGKVDVTICHRVKTVAVAGEPCPRELAEIWAAKCRFINSCGPTETTIINTAQHFQPHSLSLTIGKPTPNNTVYVLDEDLQPCPIGEVGELWAGGQGVSAGYINNQKLTDERYRPDPFMNDGSLMFRTRDLGRWNSIGELEHFGRTDDQVKIKGFRIELDAVSNSAESVKGCLQAVTLKLNAEELVTFVRPASVNVEECRKAIREKLPYYCQPAIIVALPEFPVTPRGKTDKRALLEPVQKNNNQRTASIREEGAVV